MRFLPTLRFLLFAYRSMHLQGGLFKRLRERMELRLSFLLLPGLNTRATVWDVIPELVSWRSSFKCHFRGCPNHHSWNSTWCFLRHVRFRLHLMPWSCGVSGRIAIPFPLAFPIGRSEIDPAGDRVGTAHWGPLHGFRSFLAWRPRRAPSRYPGSRS